MITPNRLFGFRASAAFLVWLSLGAATAISRAGEHADPHAEHRANMETDAPRAAQQASITIPAADLITQSGDTVSLQSEVIGDRLAVIDFVYTTCTTVCPVLSAIMMQVQDRLDGRMRDEIVLVSITVDPQRDTPERMRAYAQNLRVGNGWYWLTGDKSAVDEVLKALGAYTPNFEDHPAMVLVGDGSTGDWSRFVGFPSAQKILDKLSDFDAVRSAQAGIRE